MRTLFEFESERVGSETSKEGVTAAGQQIIDVKLVAKEVVQHDSRLQEAYLVDWNGESAGKAIIKDGYLLAVVSDRYAVVPNSRVVQFLEQLEQSGKVKILDVKYSGFRDSVVRVTIKKGNDWFYILNSEDRSVRLMVVPVVYGIPIPYCYMRKHLGKIDENIIEQFLDAVDKAKEKIEEWLEELRKPVSKEEFKEFIEVLEGRVAKKYWQPVIGIVYTRKDITWLDVLREIVKAIWRNERLAEHVRIGATRTVFNLLAGYTGMKQLREIVF